MFLSGFRNEKKRGDGRIKVTKINIRLLVAAPSAAFHAWLLDSVFKPRLGTLISTFDDERPLRTLKLSIKATNLGNSENGGGKKAWPGKRAGQEQTGG